MSGYDALRVCVRGDGRRFIANLSAPGMARKDDVWQCFVFTRGGPEWENIVVSVINRIYRIKNYIQYNLVVKCILSHKCVYIRSQRFCVWFVRCIR